MRVNAVCSEGDRVLKALFVLWRSRHIMTPFLPEIALQKLATAPRWEVRYLVALRSQTSWETRQSLLQDGNRYVRAMTSTKAFVCELLEDGGGHFAIAKNFDS